MAMPARRAAFDDPTGPSSRHSVRMGDEFAIPMTRAHASKGDEEHRKAAAEKVRTEGPCAMNLDAEQLGREKAAAEKRYRKSCVWRRHVWRRHIQRKSSKEQTPHGLGVQVTCRAITFQKGGSQKWPLETTQATTQATTQQPRKQPDSNHPGQPGCGRIAIT